MSFTFQCLFEFGYRGGVPLGNGWIPTTWWWIVDDTIILLLFLAFDLSDIYGTNGRV